MIYKALRVTKTCGKRNQKREMPWDKVSSLMTAASELHEIENKH